MQTLQITASPSFRIVSQGNSSFHFKMIFFFKAAEAEGDFLMSGLLSRPALHVFRLEPLGFSAGTVVAFGFRKEKSAPCCFPLGVLFLLIDGQCCLSLSGSSARTTGTKWFGMYQPPSALSKLPSLDHRMFRGSLGVAEVSDVLGFITRFTRQRYLNWTLGYIETIGLHRTELIAMMWTREDQALTSHTTKASSFMVSSLFPVSENFLSPCVVNATVNRTAGKKSVSDATASLKASWSA